MIGIPETLGEAFLYYGERFIVFTIAAAIGIWAGIRIRKSKNAKSTNKE